MHAGLYRPLQLVPIAILGSALIGDPPFLYDWAARHGPWGDEMVRATAGLGAAALLFWATEAEYLARAAREPGYTPPPPLQIALGIAAVALLALGLYHAGW